MNCRIKKAGGVIAPSGMPQIVARKVTHGGQVSYPTFEVENTTEIFFLPKKVRKSSLHSAEHTKAWKKITRKKR